MGVIAFSDRAVWKIARHEYRRLLDCARAFVEDADDVRALEQAKGLDGLHFDQTDPVQGRRLRAALAAAAERVEAVVHANADADAREMAFAVRLEELRRFLASASSTGSDA